MTTTAITHPNDPATLTRGPNGEFIGAAETRPYNPESRQAQALNDRLNGMTWSEVAHRHNYRSARAAEHNVGRFVAILNGRRETRIGSHVGGMSMRTFGVEIEFNGCTRYAAAAAISDALGRHIEDAGYHARRSWDEWRVEYDSSVAGRSGRGGEAVSRVLTGPEGLAEIKTVCDAIKSVGGRVNRSTGIHVHIGVGDMTGEQIARLMCAYVDRQDVFDSLVSPSRRSGHYCQHMPDREKLDNDQSLKANRTPGYYASRYRTVNVTTMNRTGTIEFRQHQGSLNATKITAWVKMLLALSTAVMATADEDLPFTGPEFIEALTGHGLDRRAAAHLARRIGR